MYLIAGLKFHAANRKNFLAPGFELETLCRETPAPLLTIVPQKGVEGKGAKYPFFMNRV